MKESKIRQIIREEVKVDFMGTEEFKGVKGNQAKNREIAEQIFEKYPHMQMIIKNIVGDHGIRYAIGNIWDAGNYLVFYFYQSGQVTNLKYFEKYNVQLQIAMGDDYNFNVSIRKK